MPTTATESHLTRNLLSLAGGAVVTGVAAAIVWAATAATTGFMPHGHCYLWQPALVWLHVGSDALIGGAYVSISITLAVLVYRARERIPFSWIMLAFGAFIIACGATHFIEIWTVWTPSYWLAAWVKVATALVSVATAMLLPPLVPKALGLANDAALSAERQRERLLALDALREAQADLERRVVDRTRALSEANQALAGEVAARERAQAAEARQAGRIRTLYEVAADGGTSTADQLTATLRLGCEWFGMDVGTIQHIDGDRVTTCYAWAAGGNPLVGQVWDLDSSYSSLPARAARAIAFHDVAESPFANSPLRRLMGMAAYIGVPLLVNGVAYGTLDFASAAPHDAPFDPADVECVRLLSRWVASVIERSDAQRAVAEARDRALEASRLKSEFVSTISHELRTPLNIILGYAELAVTGPPLDPDRRQALECIHRSGLDLLGLVDATLDVARLESGRMEVTMGTLEVAPLFDRLDAELRPLAAPGVRLMWDVEPDAELETDGGKLHTILKNLAGNALKFTAAGEVRVVHRRSADGTTTFEVRDTGIGIPPDQLPVIFEMFRQVDGSSTRRYEGVGLGLYIVQSLLRVIGGEVAVESAVGSGTVFTVRLPQAAAGAAAQSPTAAVALQ